MGNRAVVATKASGMGVYLHWNGGEESVRAFLRVARDLGVRDPDDDPAYFFARFTQIVGNFFGGTTSVGVGPLASLDTDNRDNGTFYVGKNFDIVSREHNRAPRVLNATYEFQVYRAALRANRKHFASEFNKLPHINRLLASTAKELGIDLASECKHCGSFDGTHTTRCETQKQRA